MHVRYLILVALPATSRLSDNRYNDAMATIRRVPSMDHTFQLVITRVYEDGNEELIEDEEESELCSAPLLSVFAAMLLGGSACISAPSVTAAFSPFFTQKEAAVVIQDITVPTLAVIIAPYFPRPHSSSTQSTVIIPT